jgi:hypothetical protein
MREKEPQFTVTDRRKFTAGGELRHEEGQEQREAESGPQANAAPAPAPPPNPDAGAPAAAQDASAEDPGAIPGPSREQAAQQHREYQASSDRLDELLRQSNPEAGAMQPMNFERLVQFLYMTAAMQMGAGAAPNEQPRVDILGARQSIDMLSILEEKTKGNLSENEKRLLGNALFDLRMSFLEITNAISSSAQRPRKPGGRR